MNSKVDKKIALRFDIDTISCIKKGVPDLVDISNKYDVDFTFFINFGRAIDRTTVLKRTNEGSNNNSIKLDTLKKLGLKDFLITLFINPKLKNYKKQILKLANSNNEIGLHGGINHGTWQVKGENFNITRLSDEIDFGLSEANKYNFTFHGFASPGMVTNKNLSNILISKNFNYISDTYTYKNKSTYESKKEILKKIKNIDVNLIGQRGVGYFEYQLAKNISPKKIVEDLYFEIVNSNQNTFVLYDHPLIIKFIKEEFIDFILKLKNEDIKFVKLHELV